MNQTEPPSVAFTTTVAAIIIVFCIVGLIGNILVILAIFSKKRLRTLPNSFIASMSVADIFYITCGAVPGASAFVNRGWSAGMQICKINQYVILGFCFLSLLHMVCIAVSRFIHVVHYTSSARTLNRRNIILALLITWLLLPAIIIPYHFLVVGEIRYLKKAFRCVTLSADSIVGITVFLYLACFVLPSVIVVVCYVKIRMFVSKKKQQLSLHLRKNENKKTEQTTTEAKCNGVDDTQTCENGAGTTDERGPTVSGEAQDTKTALSISNGTVISPQAPETVENGETTEKGKTADNDLANKVDTHSPNVGLHPYVSSQKTIGILDDDVINDSKPYSDLQNVESNIDVGGAHTSKDEHQSLPVDKNCVTFTEISNIKRSVDENDGKNNPAQERSNRFRLGHRGNSGIKAKSSRSIRIKRIRLIRRNPHFRTISDEELQLNRMMTVVFVIIWIGYIPYPLVRFLDTNDLTVSGTVYVTTTMLLYVAGCLNPIVYGVMHKRFRAAFVEMLTFKLIKLSRIGIMLNDSNSDIQTRSQCE